MELSEEDIEEFREAWYKDFGELLPAGQAEMEAKRLLDFFATLDLIASGNYPMDEDK